MTNQPPSDRHLALKVVMMPRDTNPHGTIFGGVILSYIDQAGAVGAYYAIRQSGSGKKPIVTVGMKSVEFHRPVFVGDVLSFWTKLVRVGTTSITIHVEVEAERDGQPEKLTEAEVSYVAVELKEDTRLPVPIKDE
ncbi:MAG: hotdog domain-containing protein [Pirellulaceae bacterium]|nr:hotdog domain-containing protein [Pirellulaceae bacterium]HJN09337.1 hotdog domain-containing protein [Pirellulaceae bacterium]